MRQLLLLRHAKSSWDDARLTDHARPLNMRGRKAADAMAAGMRELGLAPDVVLVSSARRTLQTLEALQPLEGTPIIEVMDDLYLAPWPAMMDVLRRLPQTARSAMVIGHNPGLHELGLALLGPAGATLAGSGAGSGAAQRLAAGFPTGALAEFTLAAPWQQLGEGGGRLIRYVAPRDLPEVAA